MQKVCARKRLLFMPMYFVAVCLLLYMYYFPAQVKDLAQTVDPLTAEKKATPTAAPTMNKIIELEAYKESLTNRTLELAYQDSLKNKTLELESYQGKLKNNTLELEAYQDSLKNKTLELAPAEQQAAPGTLISIGQSVRDQPVTGSPRLPSKMLSFITES